MVIAYSESNALGPNQKAIFNEYGMRGDAENRRKKTKMDLARIAAAIAVSRPTFPGCLCPFRLIAPNPDEDLCSLKGKGK